MTLRICILLQVLFLGFAVFGAIDWSWYWVFMPLIAWYAFMSLSCIAFVIMLRMWCNYNLAEPNKNLFVAVTDELRRKKQ